MGVLASAYILQEQDYAFDASRAIRDSSNTEYEFINPLFICGISEDKESEKLSSLESNLQSVLDNIDNKNITSSVYFRDLRSGYWIGINEKELYSPASLLKVPLMITYLKLSGSFPEILDRQHAYYVEADGNAGRYFEGAELFENGRSYSIRELLNLMIVHSDNNAKLALEYLLHLNNKDLWHEIYDDLGLVLPTELTAESKFMSVKMYSYFFRILYNASYLSDANSNYALELMSDARFQSGIAASVPEDVKVSQKFGERKLFYEESSTTELELHDCGIVYYPDSPYLLCVMTKGGESYEELSDIIKSISQSAYKYVDKELN